MPVYYPPQKVKEIVAEYGDNPQDTGNTKVQIALYTFRINELTKHLSSNKKDASCRRALLTMVGRRRQLLNYLTKKDINAYRALIEKLGIRK